jgi:hypothetical protein
MKKTAVLILTIIYFAVSSGVIVNMHYCMNRFESADFGLAASQKQCDKCGMYKEKSHGCCHDEIKLVKIEDDQNQTSQFSFDFASVKATATIPSLFIIASFYNNEEGDHSVYHSPPLPPQQDTYLQNCVFRI